MIKHYWLRLLGSVVLLTVLPLLLIGAELRHSEVVPAIAENGVIDLRGSDLANGGMLRLNGEWQLYPGLPMTEDDFAKADASPLLRGIAADVPDVWNGLPGLRAGLGTATYRLRVLLPEDASGIYGIRMTNIRTASRVYVNGEAIGGSGRPGLSREDTLPGNTPYVGYFKLQGSEAEIIVQVANYSYASGGIVYPLWFGTQEAIANGRELGLFEYWMTAGGFLIPALFLLLFFRLRRREAPLLQLGGFCVCSLLYVLTHGEKAALALLPDLSYETVLRVQLISSAFVYYFLARYVVLLYPKFGVRAIDRLVLAIAGGLTLAGLMLPTSQFSRSEALLLACSLLSIAYVLYVLIRAVMTRRENTLALAASIQSVLIMLIVYLLNGFGQLEKQTLLPYAIIVFCASQAHQIVTRFADLLGHAERMSERLLALDAWKDEFMLSTSHEIREPLRNIANMAAVSEREQTAADASGAREDRRLTTIAGIARRLSYLVDDMIDFSLLKSGEAEYKRRAVLLQPVVRSVLELYPQQTLSGWAVEPMSPDLPPLLADERRLGQIVHSLVAFALRHAGGAPVRLAAQAAEGRVALIIAAPGMSAALAAEREEPEFYRADESAAESAERVRLSVTRRLIELGGGEWHASGAAGVAGAAEMLRVSWPSATAEQTQANAAAASASAKRSGVANETPVLLKTRRNDELTGHAGNKRQDAEEPQANFYDWSAADPAWERREETAAAGESLLPRVSGVPEAGGSVLIVDDDQLGSQVMEHLLGGERLAIKTAASGREGLALLKEAGPFDLVIVDLVMPDMSGLELVRRIREHAALSELPVLMLSEGRLPEEALAGFRAGANDILIKPYEVSELKARAGTLLQLRSSVRRLVRTETAFLQAQIKPHFLFNALNTIMTVCRLNPPRAETLLLDLSLYLRASFDFGNLEQRVPLHRELELVRSYLAIESARFDDRLRVNIDIESDDWIPVPPLSIQPLVENAVRHGIMRKPEGGTITIRVTAAAAGWSVSVEDDGVGIPASRLADIGESAEETGGVGLANISRRLRLMYGEQLHIESWPGGGTRVGFNIPEERGA